MRYDTQLHVNSRASTSLPYGASQREILNRAAFVAAQSEITSWPGYAPTPLIPLPGLAGEAGVADVWCKHEGARFGLGSFKPTGPTFAMLAVLKAEVKARAGVEVGTQDLLAGRHAQVTANIVVSAASTDMGYGRITLTDVDVPIVILFEALVASADMDKGQCVAWTMSGGGMIEAVCWRGSLALIKGAPEDLLVSNPAEIIMHLVAREPRVLSITIDQRIQRDAIEIDEATWRRVVTYADRLLVEATETSRLTGAGSGVVVDTD